MGIREESPCRLILFFESMGSGLRLIVSFFVFLSLLSKSLQMASYQKSSSVEDRVDNEYIFLMDEMREMKEMMEEIKSSYGAMMNFTGNYPNTARGFSARMPNEDMEKLRSYSGISAVEEDEYIKGSSYYTNYWSLDRMDKRTYNLDGYYDTYFDYKNGDFGLGSYVFLVDSGINYNHYDFDGRAQNLYDNVDGSGKDCDGHGTALGSMITGYEHGVAKKSSVYSVRYLDCDRKGKVSKLLDALEYIRNYVTSAEAKKWRMLEKCVVVIPAATRYRKSIDKAVYALYSVGCVVVAAAGNDDEDACKYSPASSKYVLTVGASNKEDQKTAFSNWGDCVDIWAPGKDVYGASHKNEYEESELSGTSASAAYVGGLAAMMRSYNSSDPVYQVYLRIIRTSTCDKYLNSYKEPITTKPPPVHHDYYYYDYQDHHVEKPTEPPHRKGPHRLVYFGYENEEKKVETKCEDHYGYEECIYTVCGYNYYHGVEECMEFNEYAYYDYIYYGSDNRVYKKAPDCEDVTYCYFKPCYNGGTCDASTQYDRGYQCKCPKGWEGYDCEINHDDCYPNPCKHASKCYDKINAYECECKAGYYGTDCGHEYNECDSHPCQHYGTCVDKVNAYECICDKGFEGINCETETDECLSNPCKHGGTCENYLGYFTCICMQGYTGVMCEIDIDECESQSCYNGGTCVDRINSFTCLCAPDYEGEFCGNQIDDCASYPCQNGGYCLDGINLFTCECGSAYTGTQCESEINFCDPNPCKNNGTCDRTYYDSGYECQCLQLYTGLNCETEINNCDPNPCQNGGTCTTNVEYNSYDCQCPPNYEGYECNYYYEPYVY